MACWTLNQCLMNCVRNLDIYIHDIIFNILNIMHIEAGREEEESSINVLREGFSEVSRFYVIHMEFDLNNLDADINFHHL